MTIYERAISEYKSLFKAGVVLVGISLAGMLQSYPIISKLGDDARKAEYQAEEKYNIEKIEEFKCSSLSIGVAECKFAQYKYQENQNAMKFSAFIIVMLAYAGLILMIFSAWSFVAVAKRDSTQNKT